MGDDTAILDGFDLSDYPTAASDFKLGNWHQATEGALSTACGSLAAKYSLCVVCCAEPEIARAASDRIARALAGRCSVTLLSVTEGSGMHDGAHSIVVPIGTKLSKLSLAAGHVTTDLVCICDPDIDVATDGCIAVFDAALAEHRLARAVVSFGVIQVRNASGLLGQLISLDKWLSHRILRPILWRLGVGITLPGQFLIISTDVLRSIDRRVDSYLDDLYLGWLCRHMQARVCRETCIVGYEATRASWLGLVAQRMRWMKGFMQLIRQLAHESRALPLLAVHFLAYHGVPLLLLFAACLVMSASPVLGIGMVMSVALALSGAARCRLCTSIIYVTAFPLVHLLAICLWWLPVGRTFLTRR
jgi:cellulose synthase/poly-beta-1,6-N-acetylglucosamine synthase-like glycosyltransferase